MTVNPLKTTESLTEARVTIHNKISDISDQLNKVSDRENNFLTYFYTTQIISNTLLFLAVNVVGVMSYLVTDVNQRRSFLDTRKAIQVKLSFEKEEKNQVNDAL